MRTTLTLDDDVAARLEQLRVRDGRSFEQIVNDTLRRGLAQREAEPPHPPGPYTRSADLGMPLVGDIDDVSGLLARREGESRR